MTSRSVLTTETVVFRFLTRFRSPRDSSAEPFDDEAPPILPAQTRTIEELLEASQKGARAQVKLALKLEDLERKLQAGFADLRSAIAATASRERSALPVWDDLLDALDLLEQATSSLEAGESTGVAEGLHGVSARLSRMLDQSSLRRLGSVGARPDGRLFRVVGTQARDELPDGTIASVLRAAVVRGDEIVREGEVLVNQHVIEEE